MKKIRMVLLSIHLKTMSVVKRLRALMIFIFVGVKFKIVGTKCKVRGEGISVGVNVVVGDFCWIEAVNRYGTQSFSPKIIMGKDVALSDFVHISAIKHIEIGEGTLIGSKVYIGDHSHGHYQNYALRQLENEIMPKNRPLADEENIIIGKNCWIGDGVVILAGTQIGDNGVVGANSVVKGVFDSNVIIAGVPAKKIRN